MSDSTIASGIGGGVEKFAEAVGGVAKQVVEKLPDLMEAGQDFVDTALLEPMGLDKDGKSLAGFRKSWDGRSKSKAEPPKMTLIGQIANAGKDGSNVVGVLDDPLGHMRYTTSDAGSQRSVVLHMPQDISETLEASWEDGVGAVDKILSRVSNTKEVLRGGEQKMADASFRRLARGAEKVAGIEDLEKSVMRRQGLAENQHSHQFFSGMSFKSHSFKHKLISFTREDTLMNHAIIEFFKRNMKPSFDNPNSRRFLTYPPTFNVRFMQYDKLNTFLPTIRPCVCTNVEVSYTGSGTWSSFRNGAPVDIDLTLQFNEVELPYD